MDVTAGTILALATALTWGSREILLRKAFETTKPLQGLFITLWATFFIASIGAFFYESSLWNRLTATDVFLWLIVGLIQFPLAMTLYYKGIDSVGGSRTSVASNISTIVTPLLGIALFGEPSSLNIIAGVFATGAGIFMVSASNFGADWKWHRGILYGLLAGLIWSVSNLLTRIGLLELRLPMTALVIAVGVSLLPLFVLFILKYRGMNMMVPNPSQNKKLIGGCFLSGLGQVTLFAALALAPTVFVIPTYNLKSLVTIILAYVIIPKSEKVNMLLILGAMLAIGGIVLINI